MDEPPINASANDVSVLYRQASAASWLGLWINVLLAIVKLVAGVLGHSIAMIADAVNSLGDALSSAGVLYALCVAKRPPDSNHPYGHSRAETVAALTVAVLIATSALGIGIEALRSLASDHPIPPAWVLWVAFGNIVVKEAIYQYKRKIAVQIDSQSLLAAAWDHRSDALSSAAVLAGLAVVRLTDGRIIWADEVAALLVVVIIFYTSAKLYRANASQLMDEQCSEGVINEMVRLALAVPGVVKVEQVRARRSGLEIHADLHIEVDPTISVEAGHNIGHAVQRLLLKEMTAVSHVLVHIEPAE